MGLRSNFEESYPEEVELQQLFSSVGATFTRLARGVENSKEQSDLVEITENLLEAKSLIQKFEAEARKNEMKLSMLASRKKALTSPLAEYEQQKRNYVRTIKKKPLISSADDNVAPRSHVSHSQYDDMTTEQMMVKGRKDITETEQGLIRSNRIVEDTIQVATSTAETLNGQTEQIERTLDGLERIDFSLKHAKRVMRDIGRGLATDKCIRLMTLLVIVALVVMLVLKIFKVGQPRSKEPENVIMVHTSSPG